MAEASSTFEVVPGGGTVEEERFRAGVPVGVCWLSVKTLGSGTWSGSRSWIGESRVSTTSSMEVCRRLERSGGCGLGPLVWEGPARREFWVVRGLEDVGIKLQIDVRDWSLKYCYELGDGLRAYQGSIFLARTRLQLMCCTTRHLLSLNFRRGTDEGSEVWTVSSRDNQCRFQTEEHT